MPEKFVLEYYIKVENHHSLEKILHQELTQYRPNKSREFFRITVPKVVAIIRELVGEVRDETVLYRNPDEVERETVEINRKKQIKERARKLETYLEWQLKTNRSNLEKLSAVNCHNRGIIGLVGGFMFGYMPAIFFFDENMSDSTFLFMWGVVAVFCYWGGRLCKANEVNKALRGMHKIILDKASSFERECLNDHHEIVDMLRYENAAKLSFESLLNKRGREVSGG